MTLQDSINRVILAPRLHPLLAILKGTRNGLVYGAKIRFPHALVMTLLFRDGSARAKLRFIFRATWQHARNLASFVTIYKSIMLALRILGGGKEASAHPFLAGLVGGWHVFGSNNPINQQIVLYVFARSITALAKLPSKHGLIPGAADVNPELAFRVFAALSWAAVMWLFRHERDTLQGSLQASMQYLYLDSNRWDGLRTLFWHNR